MAFENLKSTGIKYLLTKLKTVFLQIKDAVKTVNNVEADENGNITINSVPFAQNLESESSQRNYDSFILRTSGGEASINDGDAWLMNIHGNAVHDGFVPESIVMTVSAIERENPITAEIDNDTFVAYVEESGTITFVYSSSWNLDPELYGITIDGTPVSGDIITVVYVKEERGTITVANPQSFFATGWNLYSTTLGYARVVKYSHGYKISGSGTALQYSATLSGERTTIVVTDGNFDIPSDGYVWVTNGDSTTAIWMTWTDWTETANNGEYEGYTESVIDLSSVMSTYFPDGLMKVGNTYDEIDLNLGQVYVRVERMSYTAENLETAKNSGREYDYDENYIYLAKATAIVNSVTINGMFTTSDHGMDGFIGTDVEVVTQILYGNNLKNKLERDVLTISQQTLTEAQQEQVRTNIGAASQADVTALNSNFTWEDVSWEDWINVTSNINTTYSWVKKRGKEICGCIYTPSNASIAAKGAIGTINSAYRPLNACTASLVNSATTDNGVVWINGTSGVINVTNAVSGTCIFTFHYLTA